MERQDKIVDQIVDSAELFKAGKITTDEVCFFMIVRMNYLRFITIKHVYSGHLSLRWGKNVRLIRDLKIPIR